MVWGSHDCIMAVCNHVLRQTGIDPAAPWRGSYNDEAGALALMLPFGGVLGIMRHGMAKAGFAEGPPGIGSPVVVDIGGHHVAGLNLGRFVVMAGRRGPVRARPAIIAAWCI